MFLRCFVALLLVVFAVAQAQSITCANIRCAGPCVDTPKGPRCSPRPTRNSMPHPCAFTTCSPPLQCVAQDGVAHCVQFKK